MNIFNTKAFWLVYDGESEGEGESTGTEGENKKIEPKPEEKAKTTTFTQEDINRLLTEDRKKNQQNRDKLIKELETLRNTATLTETEKESLSSRIEQLQNETASAQELAKKDKEKLLKDHQKELTKAQNDTTFWKDKYSKEKIEREIIDAALEYDGASPQQFVKLLRTDTKLVEELNKEGKPTGEWIPKVNFAMTNDEDGSIKFLELNVKEAVKRMKEMKEHWNLFKSGASGGLGGFSQPSNGGLKGKTPPTDPSEFRKWRKENVPTGRR